ncbi:MAG: hypothetical protein IKW39_03465 [Alphaproteobacteria bacterium]|nr:hypothetical protein [Alphaproteobacteria bacterium]
MSYKSELLETSKVYHLGIAEQILEGTLFVNEVSFAGKKAKIMFSEEGDLLKEVFGDEKEFLFLSEDTLLKALLSLVSDFATVTCCFEEKNGRYLLKALEREEFAPFRLRWTYELYENFIKLQSEAKDVKVLNALKAVAEMFLEEIRKSNSIVTPYMFAILCKYSPQVAQFKLDQLFNDEDVHPVYYDEVLDVLGADDISKKIGEFLLYNGFISSVITAGCWLIKSYHQEPLIPKLQVAFIRIALREMKGSCNLSVEDYQIVLRPFLKTYLEPKIASEILLRYISYVRKHSFYDTEKDDERSMNMLVIDLLDIMMGLPSESQVSLLSKCLFQVK